MDGLDFVWISDVLWDRDLDVFGVVSKELEVGVSSGGEVFL